MNVYVVTDGAYEDTHVDAVFSTRAKAEAYVEALRSSYADIEEWEVDLPPSMWFGITVEMCRNGIVRSVCELHKDTPIGYRGRAHIREGYVQSNLMPDGSQIDKRFEEYLHVFVHTRDRDEAVRRTDELRRRLIAERAWKPGFIESPHPDYRCKQCGYGFGRLDAEDAFIHGLTGDDLCNDCKGAR